MKGDEGSTLSWMEFLRKHHIPKRIVLNLAFSENLAVQQAMLHISDKSKMTYNQLRQAIENIPLTYGTTKGETLSDKDMLQIYGMLTRSLPTQPSRFFLWSWDYKKLENLMQTDRNKIINWCIGMKKIRKLLNVK